MNVVIGGNQSLIFSSGANNMVAFRPAFWPTDVPGLSSWFSADYGVYTNVNNLAQNGGSVSLWTSRINSITLQQTSSNKQPTFFNGGVKFDGGDVLGGANPSALNSPLNYYLAIDSISVNNILTNLPPAVIIKQSSANPGIAPYVFSVNYTGILAAANPDNQYITSNVNNKKTAIACIFLNNDEAIIKNGNLDEYVASLGQAGNTETSFFVGSHNNTYGSQFLKGTIYEILVYAGTEHTVEQQNLVLQYLANKWGLTL
ncbi:MAG: hypothetical protein RL736_7 [Pseudomonadota bacterium]|jgi:hypothetical protein